MTKKNEIPLEGGTEFWAEQYAVGEREIRLLELQILEFEKMQRKVDVDRKFAKEQLVRMVDSKVPIRIFPLVTGEFLLVKLEESEHASYVTITLVRR